MQALSRREEEEMFQGVRAQANAKCDEFVRAFADCCRGRSFSMAWKCQDNLKVMNDCLRLNCTQEILDAARIEYMQNREVKKQEALYKLKRKRLEDYAKAHKITVAEVELQLAYAEKLRTEALAKMNRES